MTVQELIDALMALDDKTAPVDTEGCDCIGPAKGVSTTTWGSLLIERDPEGD